MMLLRVLVFALAALLVYTLYLPSADPPERFLQQMRAEHALNASFWGEDDAYRILSRALSLYAREEDLAPAAFAADRSVAPDAGEAVGREMSAVVGRLLHNRYGQGLDAVVLLATYRFSALRQWLPWVAALVLIACFDGGILRAIRSKEFLAHSPTRFALSAIGATLCLVLGALFLVVPAAVHPLLLGSAPLAAGAFAARAIGHFRR